MGSWQHTCAGSVHEVLPHPTEPVGPPPPPPVAPPPIAPLPPDPASPPPLPPAPAAPPVAPPPAPRLRTQLFRASSHTHPAAQGHCLPVRSISSTEHPKSHEAQRPASPTSRIRASIAKPVRFAALPTRGLRAASPWARLRRCDSDRSCAVWCSPRAGRRARRARPRRAPLPQRQVPARLGQARRRRSGPARATTSAQ